MPNRRGSSRWPVMVAVGVTVFATGCTGDATAPPATETTATATTASSGQPTAAAPKTSPSASRSPSAPTTSRSPSTAPSAQLTASELRKALLGIKDVPPGFERDTSTDRGEGGVSSRRPSCAPLVRLLNGPKLPGSVATASTAFSGGSDGTYLQEDLDAMRSAEAAAKVIEGYRAAVKQCKSIRFVDPEAGAAALAVREISFAELGDDSFAARFRAGAGPLEGLEIIQVGAQSGSVVLGMALIGFHPADAEAATQQAMDKLRDQLGATSSS